VPRAAIAFSPRAVIASSHKAPIPRHLRLSERNLAEHVVPAQGFDTTLARPNGKRGYFPRKAQAWLDTLQIRMWAVESEMAEQAHDQAGSAVLPLELLEDWKKLQTLHAIIELVWNTPDSHQSLLGIEIAEGKLHLNFRRHLPDWLAGLPVMALDASAHRFLSEAVFALSDPDHRDFMHDPYLSFAQIRAQAEHQYLVKVSGAPTGKRALSDSVAGRDDRLRRDSSVEEVLRVARALAGRVGAGGLATYKATAAYAASHGLLGTLKPGTHGKLRGRNDWKEDELFINTGRLLPASAAIEIETKAFFALAPQAVNFSLGLEFGRVERGLRLAAGGGAVPVAATAHPDAYVQVMLEQHAIGSVEQAIGRARGARRSAENPVVVFDFSDVIPDISYDAVIEWSDLAPLLDEGAAMLHRTGVLPLKGAELMKVDPAAFVTAGCAKLYARDVAPKTAKALLEGSLYSGFADFGALSPATPAKALLNRIVAPPQAILATLTLKTANRHMRETQVILDERRAGEGAETYARSMGQKLVSWRSAEADKPRASGKPARTPRRRPAAPSVPEQRCA
jgi:hypothetical protein